MCEELDKQERSRGVQRSRYWVVVLEEDSRSSEESKVLLLTQGVRRFVELMKQIL